MAVPPSQLFGELSIAVRILPLPRPRPREHRMGDIMGRNTLQDVDMIPDIATVATHRPAI